MPAPPEDVPVEAAAFATIEARPRAGPVPIGVGIRTHASLDEFTWRVEGIGIEHPVTRRFEGAREHLSRPVDGFRSYGKAEAVAPLVEGRASLTVILLRRGEEVARTELDGIAIGPPCADADGDGACAYDGWDPTPPSVGLQRRYPDCDDRDAATHAGAIDLPDDGVDQDCDGYKAGDVDVDGYDALDDCDKLDRDIHPGAPELEDGLDDDCDGVVPAGEDPPLAMTLRDGRIGVRDGAVWRVTAPVADDLERAPLPLSRPDGGPAWLAEQSGVDTLGLGTGAFGGQPFALLLLPEGDSGLAVAGMVIARPGVYLEDYRNGIHRDTTAPVTLTSDGFANGGVGWRWYGPFLAPIPASADAELRFVPNAQGLEVENVGDSTVDLTGLALVCPRRDGRLWISAIHGLDTRPSVPPAGHAVVAGLAFSWALNGVPLFPTYEGPLATAFVDFADWSSGCSIRAGDRLVAVEGSD